MLEACRALASIAYDSSSRAAAVDAGAVPLLLDALARYPKLTQVADAVIRALCTLAHEPAGAHAIVAAGGVPLIVNSVRAVPKTSCCFVATNACGVLASVSKARDNCAAIVATGGVHMLRAVLCKHVRCLECPRQHRVSSWMASWLLVQGFCGSHGRCCRTQHGC